MSKYNIANVDEKIKASRELCRVIASFGSDIERELYSRKLSSILDIPLVSIQKEVAAILRKRTNEQKSKEQSELYRITSGLGDRVNPESASNIRASKIEEALLGIILLKGDLISFVSDKLTAEDFVTPFCKSVYESIVSVYAEFGRFDISYIQENFTIEQFSRITKMMTERERLSKNDADTLKSLIDSLKKEKTKKDDVDDSFDNIFDLIKNKKKS